MAFLQPTRPVAGRQPRISSPSSENLADRPASPAGAEFLRGSTHSQGLRQAHHESDVQAALRESQTWILFSPATDATTTADAFSLKTLSTQGRSRPSERGSRHAAEDISPGTTANADEEEEDGGDDVRRGNVRTPTATDSAALVDEEDLDDEELPESLRLASRRDRGGQEEHGSVLSDTELDSLDSHLPEFRPHANATPRHLESDDVASPAAAVTSPPPMLLPPSHDGLGSFLASAAANYNPLGGGSQDQAELQDRLYAFERFNPRRIRGNRTPGAAAGPGGYWRASSFTAAYQLLEQQAATPLEDMNMAGDDENDDDEEDDGHVGFESAEARQMRDKMRRIEAWRAEQSRYLVEEIQRETRRRRMSEAAMSATARGATATATATPPHAHDTVSQIQDPGVDADEDGPWHDQASEVLGTIDAFLRDARAEDSERTEKDGAETEAGERGGILARITKVVIRDLMGIDDDLLNLLFGEALPAQLQQLGQQDSDDAALAFPAPDDGVGVSAEAVSGGSFEQPDQSQQQPWQVRILERISRELGILMHQLGRSGPETHPGAFSTYVRSRDAPLPYAGLPVIPEASSTSHRHGGGNQTATAVPEHPPGVADAEVSELQEPEFHPTVDLRRQADAVDTAPAALAHVEESQATAATTGASFTQDEWEQDLDIRLVFRYLRSRFMRSSAAAAASALAGPGLFATSPSAAEGAVDGSSTAAAVARASARVRAHHPLISHHHQRHNRHGGHHDCRHHHHYHHHSGGRRLSFKATASSVSQQQTSPVTAAGISRRSQHHHHQHHRTASSCARSSASRSTGGGSRQYYWEHLGSGPGTESAAGTGSLIAAGGGAGGMGSWGEV